MGVFSSLSGRLGGRFPLSLALLLLIILVGSYITYRTVSFVHIFGHHAGVAFTQTEVAQAFEKTAYPKAYDHPVVPKIIHQVFHNWTDPDDEVLPQDWADTRQTCIDVNPGWQYKLWTSRSSHAFIKENYPWFLETYEAFRLPIQKVDVVRYFILRHYGGIYIDLDNGCLTSLEPLRYYPTWTTDGGRGALSNNILGAEPNHPFWIFLTNSIQYYAWNYPLPFITVSYATGQWFETVMWEEYHRNLKQDEPPLVRIMMDGREGASPWVFFDHTRGGTWNDWDKEAFEWIGDNILVVIIGGVLAAGGILALCIGIRRYFGRRRAFKKKGYEQVYDLDER